MPLLHALMSLGNVGCRSQRVLLGKATAPLHTLLPNVGLDGALLDPYGDPMGDRAPRLKRINVENITGTNQTPKWPSQSVANDSLPTFCMDSSGKKLNQGSLTT